jgi:hypothetical protein
MTIREKLEKMIDNIDPQIEGIVILLVNDVQIEFGISDTGNEKFDIDRLVTALNDEVKRLEEVK